MHSRIGLFVCLNLTNLTQKKVYFTVFLLFCYGLSILEKKNCKENLQIEVINYLMFNMGGEFLF